MKNIITSSVIAVGLALCSPFAFAKEKHHEEENISQSDVPATVQKTADAEAKGSKIVRWEKEGANYEAVIEKNGKEIGVRINAKGKVVSRHDESKEKGEKH
jgi:hypothetical protein